MNPVGNTREYSEIVCVMHTEKEGIFPHLAVRWHLLTLPSNLGNLMQLKNYYRRCYHRPGFRLYHLLYHLLSLVLTPRGNQVRNSKWVSFLGTIHPQAQTFWKIARYFTTTTRSVPPLSDHRVQVFISAGKAELLAHHFERILHLKLNVGTANNTRTVNRTVNKYFSFPPTRPWDSAHKPIWTPTSNSISQNRICHGNRGYLSYYALKSLPQSSHAPAPTFKSYYEVWIFPLRLEIRQGHSLSKTWQTTFWHR